MSPERTGGGVCSRFIHVCRPRDTFACDSKQSRFLMDHTRLPLMNLSRLPPLSHHKWSPDLMSSVVFVCCILSICVLGVFSIPPTYKPLGSAKYSREAKQCVSSAFLSWWLHCLIICCTKCVAVVADSTANKRLQRTVCE